MYFSGPYQGVPKINVDTYKGIYFRDANVRFNARPDIAMFLVPIDHRVTVRELMLHHHLSRDSAQDQPCSNNETMVCCYSLSVDSSPLSFHRRNSNNASPQSSVVFTRKPLAAFARKLTLFI
jgi:hypothetical protein